MKKNPFKSLLGLGLALLPLLAFLPFISMTPEPITKKATCAGIGLSGSSSKPLNCGGDCQGGWECINIKGTDPDLGKYYFCGCWKEGESDPNEPICCHLIAIKKPGEEKYSLDVNGNCTFAEGCAATDGLTCQISNTQPVCLPPANDPL